RGPPRSPLLPYPTLFRSAWPKEAGAPATVSATDERGNQAWITAGTVLVRLDDGDKPAVSSVLAGKAIGSLAAGEDGQVYFTQGVDRKSTRLNSSHVKISY